MGAKTILINKIIEDGRLISNDIFVKKLPEILEETKTKSDATFKAHIIDKFNNIKSGAGNFLFIRNYMAGILRDTKDEESLNAKYKFFNELYEKVWEHLHYKTSYFIQDKNEVINNDISLGIKTVQEVESKLKAIMNIFYMRGHLYLEDYLTTIIKQIKTQDDVARFNETISYARSLTDEKNLYYLSNMERQKVLAYFEMQLPKMNQRRIDEINRVLKISNPYHTNDSKIDSNKIHDILYVLEQNIARKQYSQGELEQIYTILSKFI